MELKPLIKNSYLGLRNILLALCLPRSAQGNVVVKSMVAIRIDRIGDLVVSLPALKALKAIFPEARLAVLAQKSALPLLDGLDWIDEKIPYQGFWQTVKVLRRRNFSLAVDLLMDYTLKTALLARLSKAKLTAGFDIAGRGRCFGIAVIPSGNKKFMYEHILDLVRAIAGVFNIDISRIPIDVPRLIINEKNKLAADEFLRKQLINEKDLIVGIHPGAKFPSQCWESEKFARLADTLNKKYQAKIVIIGNSQELSLINKVVSLMQTSPVLAVGLALGDLSAVIARMNILVCNNSGPLHIAAGLGVPTVSTMGPTDPILWYPAGAEQFVIRKDLFCSPCNKSDCFKHRCMDLITVEEVLAKVSDCFEKEGVF